MKDLTKISKNKKLNSYRQTMTSPLDPYIQKVEQNLTVKTNDLIKYHEQRIKKAKRQLICGIILIVTAIIMFIIAVNL